MQNARGLVRARRQARAPWQQAEAERVPDSETGS